MSRDTNTLVLFVPLLFLCCFLICPEIRITTANFVPTPPPKLPSIYIKPDGSVNSSFPIQQNGNLYTLTGDIANYTLEVQRDNIVIDGANYSLDGYGIGIGIDLTNRTSVTVKNLKLARFRIGVLLENCSDVRLTGTVIQNSGTGFSFISASGILLRNNFLVDCPRSFDISGSEISHFLNDMDTSNTFNGKPIHYLVNQADLTVNPFTFPDLDFIIFVNCTRLTVQNLNLTGDYNGIYLAYTTNSNIINNKIADFNIKLDYSSNNVVSGNIADIYMEYSPNNNIANNTGELVLRSLSDDNTIVNNRGSVQLYGSSNNTIKNNQLTRADTGLSLAGSHNNNIVYNNLSGNNCGLLILGTGSNNSIVENVIANNSRFGILLEGTGTLDEFYYANSTRIVGNTIVGSSSSGIELRSAYNTTIIGNYLSSNSIGINLYGDLSRDCHIIGNTLTNNAMGIRIAAQYLNSFYHNNFINNTQHVTFSRDWKEVWDSGYPSGGNYWSGYDGVDNCSGLTQTETGKDGIGDVAVILNSVNADNYPLMAPFTSFDAGTWEWTHFNVHVVSNSTVSDFSFKPEVFVIEFKANCEPGTMGFCRVTIPKDLIDAEDNWTVLVNSESTNPTINEDTDNTYLYFTYGHNTQTIEIKGTHAIPEFPSGVLLLLLVAMLSVILIYRMNKVVRAGK
jgi:parallel beta-helix repeat protein